jgi:predicted signal transduction protein with EAL and GGDEF domain
MRFRDHLRKGDTLGRLGGDEFVVLLDDLADVQEAAAAARKLIALAAEPFSMAGHEFYVTASIGIAVSPGDGTEPVTLLKHAYIAMYRAKSQGKNNFQFFSPDATATTFEQLMLDSALRKALERDDSFSTTSPSWTSSPAGQRRWRRWCAGAIPTLAWSPRRASSRWPRRPA